MSKTIFTYANLLRAYYDCRTRKRRSLSALGFECDLENNLYQLKSNLQKRAYQPDRSVYFVVTKPKPREIFAAEFTDRITHHLLINQIEALWEKRIFLPCSCACRKNKGHHYGMRYLYHLSKKYRYFGQFDLSNFFSSINREILFKLVKNVVNKQARPSWWKEDVLWLTKVIIDTDPTADYFYKGDPSLKKLVPEQKSLFNQDPGVGLPIGNLSSQFLANVYLHELDEYVTKTLGFNGFVRYVDDFVLLSNSKAKIIKARSQIEQFLQNTLAMTLHPKKQQIQPTSHGIPFVGYFIKPTGVTVRSNVVKAVKNKLYDFSKSTNSCPEELIVSLNSYYGHFRQARSFRLRRHLFQKHLPKKLWPKFWIVGQYKYFRKVGECNQKQHQSISR